MIGIRDYNLCYSIMSFPFSNLPDDYYREGYVAKLVEIDDVKEEILMNKIGGSRPYLKWNEIWPKGSNGKHLNFICQFDHPIDKVKIRFFLNFENLSEYLFDIIKIENDLENRSFEINDIKHLPCHQITEWVSRKELLPFDDIYGYYCNHLDQLMTDFKDDLEEYDLPNHIDEIKQMTFKNVKICALLNDQYRDSQLNPDSSNIKVGCTPASYLEQETLYMEGDNGSLLQLVNVQKLKFPFEIGHILMGDLNFVYESSIFLVK